MRRMKAIIGMLRMKRVQRRICKVGFYASCEFLVSCNISNFPALSEFISVSEDCQGLKQAGEKRKQFEENNSRKQKDNVDDNFNDHLLVLTITSRNGMTPTAVRLKKENYKFVFIAFLMNKVSW